MSERTRSDGSASNPEQTWKICRQDDSGNRLIIDSGLSEGAARSRLMESEAHRHKQFHRIEVEPRVLERRPGEEQA